MKDTVIIYNIENIILILYNSLFININNLLNTSKKFNKYKKKMYDWNLNKIWSREYYKNLFFNKYLNTQINDCSSQLSINLSGCIEVYKVDHIGNLKNLNLSGCINVSNVDNLGAIKILNLSGCINIINVDNLGNVENLNLCWCYKITNIDKLDRVKILNISGCDNITNISKYLLHSIRNNITKLNTNNMIDYYNLPLSDYNN